MVFLSLSLKRTMIKLSLDSSIKLPGIKQRARKACELSLRLAEGGDGKPLRALSDNQPPTAARGPSFTTTGVRHELPLGMSSTFALMEWDRFVQLQLGARS